MIVSERTNERRKERASKFPIGLSQRKRKIGLHLLGTNE